MMLFADIPIWIFIYLIQFQTGGGSSTLGLAKLIISIISFAQIIGFELIWLLRRCLFCYCCSGCRPSKCCINKSNPDKLYNKNKCFKFNVILLSNITIICLILVVLLVNVGNRGSMPYSYIEYQFDYQLLNNNNNQIIANRFISPPINSTGIYVRSTREKNCYGNN